MIWQKISEARPTDGAQCLVCVHSHPNIKTVFNLNYQEGHGFIDQQGDEPSVVGEIKPDSLWCETPYPE